MARLFDGCKFYQIFLSTLSINGVSEEKNDDTIYHLLQHLDDVKLQVYIGILPNTIDPETKKIGYGAEGSRVYFSDAPSLTEIRNINQSRTVISGKCSMLSAVSIWPGVHV